MIIPHITSRILSQPDDIHSNYHHFTSYVYFKKWANYDRWRSSGFAGASPLSFLACLLTHMTNPGLVNGRNHANSLAVNYRLRKKILAMISDFAWSASLILTERRDRVHKIVEQSAALHALSSIVDCSLLMRLFQSFSSKRNFRLLLFPPRRWRPVIVNAWLLQT